MQYITLIEQWKKKKHDYLNYRKAFDKIQHLFMMKTLNIQNTSNKRELIQHHKGHLGKKKLTANTILNSRRVKTFPHKIRNVTRMPTFTTAVHHCTGSSSQIH